MPCGQLEHGVRHDKVMGNQRGYGVMRTAGHALLLVTAVAALSGSITSAYLARQTELPALACDEPTHDFGELPQGETVRTTFELVNRHRREINIHRVATSCDCSDYELSGQSILPGDSVTLSATWRIGSHRDHSTTALQVLYSRG